MKICIRDFLFVIALSLFLISWQEFSSIDQPEFADPNSTFDVPITVQLAATEGKVRGYFGVRLPKGWTIQDSIPFQGIINGTFVYSSAYSDSMETYENSAEGYFWWVGVTDSISSLSDGTIHFIARITTDEQSGVYSLEYMISDHIESFGDLVLYSGPHLICVNAPTALIVTTSEDRGEGSIRQALADICIGGEITFDLSYPATIVLDTTLKIDRSVTITGPDAGELILSGNDSNRIFVIDEDLTVNISNLAITNGKSKQGGGGILCDNSALSLTNVVIDKNYASWGGGICTSGDSAVFLNDVVINNNSASGGGGGIAGDSPINLTDVMITNNSADERGGGISCSGDIGLSLNGVIISYNTAGKGGGISIGSPISLDDVIITHNSAYRGGGIYSSNGKISLSNTTVAYNSAYSGGGLSIGSDSIEFKNVTIANNKGFKYGGGIHIRHMSNSSLIFDADERCNIYLNTAGHGNDIYYYKPYDPVNTIPVLLDTFSVLNPTDIHVYNREKFSFNIQNGKVSQSSTDLYVSPDGDNNHSGTSESEALKTISHAIIKIWATNNNPLTIYLNNGLYSASSNGEIFPLSLPHWVTLSGKSRNRTILDAENYGNLICINKRVCRVKNLTVTRGSASHGGGINCISSTLYLENVRLDNNWGHAGGGIYCLESWLSLRKVFIINNFSMASGGGIYLATNSQLNFHSGERCNIFGNISGTGASELYKPENGNIISVIVDTFTVMHPSDEHAEPINEFIFDILHPMVTNISQTASSISPQFVINQNYPNPFNPSTKITFTLPKPEHVTLTVYNTIGQKVATLLDTKMNAGSHDVQFDASTLPSGIYFYRIQTGEFSQVRKMVLLR